MQYFAAIANKLLYKKYSLAVIVAMFVLVAVFMSKKYPSISTFVPECIRTSRARTF